VKKKDEKNSQIRETSFIRIPAKNKAKKSNSTKHTAIVMDHIQKKITFKNNVQKVVND